MEETAFGKRSIVGGDPQLLQGRIREVGRAEEGALAEGASPISGDLGVPTLVLHRRRDALVSSEEASEIASRIPGARLEVVDDDAHVHYVGDVETLAERIVAFTTGGQRTPSAQLTAREAEVLDLVAAGCKNAEVAERLALSVRTVERHLLNAYTKLGVAGRSEAVAWWLRRRPTVAKPPA